MSNHDDHPEPYTADEMRARARELREQEAAENLRRARKNVEQGRDFLDGLPDASGTFTGTFDKAMTASEEMRRKALSCFCVGTGWIAKSWVYKREFYCDCGGRNLSPVFHPIECDAAPCPFCPAETPGA